MEWQPIETAPIEERIVAAYFGPNERMTGAAAVARFFKWDTMPERMLASWPFGEVQPTHWMPLPEPPNV